MNVLASAREWRLFASRAYNRRKEGENYSALRGNVDPAAGEPALLGPGSSVDRGKRFWYGSGDSQ
jgi:hypothetical protein